MIAFVQNYPLATLVAMKGDGYPVAAHAPLVLEREGTCLVCYGHLKKTEAFIEALANQTKVLVVFQGPNAYVSGSWYRQQHTTSTWNYTAVHAEGILQMVDEKGLVAGLRKLSAAIECESSPSAFHRLAPSYLQQKLTQLAGFVICLSKWKYISRLSQNQDKESYLQIIEQLMKGNGMEQDVAMMMYIKMG